MMPTSLSYRSNGDFLPRNGCDSGRNHHDIESIVRRHDKDLLSWMNTYWPSNRLGNNVFWAHEWNKHGTCVTTLEPRCYGDKYRPQQEVGDYFAQVRQVFSKYNIYQALSNQGIIPGASYPLANLIGALRRELNIEARITCRGRQIQEVHMWFHVKGTENYIPAEAHGSNRCPKLVVYPNKNRSRRSEPAEAEMVETIEYVDMEDTMSQFNRLQWASEQQILSPKFMLAH
ncbi:hypothetical protein IWQ60_006864 [Tieghemiomyces parasiticus]|uniref:ribonuclease T2 n=1 Tax=Tieghemiomyces parasiticus TaxID=78921 RepID=A0A9W8A1J1_9FUNG|nr:hypothetical protein IWQ60_006864 [Tieghemiomyces parasiticus]